MVYMGQGGHGNSGHGKSGFYCTMLKLVQIDQIIYTTALLKVHRLNASIVVVQAPI